MTNEPLEVRALADADIPAVLAIYAHYVRETAISFELDPPTLEEFTARVRKVQSKWLWLVAERDSEIVGYAYASEWNPRPAYRFTTETTVYVRADARGQGVGRALYAALFDQLHAMGFKRALAGIALPNEGSSALHRSFGFEPVGVLNRVGFKFDLWHDVIWLQRDV